ncbi:hypothetical protein OESDEN_15033 [Oesophagostomum dentatum]|uniref:MULE transposase domain-containing protein n=1 Tax=Oesophagostomum dentatum TaxID=61180 RepID=A0A0B1SPY6_OESDE|nr:hypothetical protein OESDEN_15033 [Oesophagostomum dentatum]
MDANFFNSSLQSYIMDFDENSGALTCYSVPHRSVDSEYTENTTATNEGKVFLPTSWWVVPVTSQIQPSNTDSSFQAADEPESSPTTSTTPETPRARYYGTEQVVGNEFLSDPCKIGHVCNPVDSASDVATRATYEKACKNGLGILVADGIHSKSPKGLPRSSQLYVVHGVCGADIDAPILFAIMEKRTQDAYKIVFGALREHLTRFGLNLSDLRVVMDYEKASINAARATFQESIIQGCAFHLALAWNRRRNSLGLTPFISGQKSDPLISDWWNTIKGLIFLPRRLHREVRALKQPPVPPEHPAFLNCTNFLKYLGNTWYKGMLAQLWDKYMVKDVRTTNIAEAFHRRLCVLVPEDHPSLETVIKTFHDLEMDARAVLNALELHPGRKKKISSKAEQRRDEVASAMKLFDDRYTTSGVTRTTIENYCKEMAAFVPDRAF